MNDMTINISGESIEDLRLKAYEEAYDHGWTDGLPIIPASGRRIDEFVAAAGRKRNEVIGVLPPRKGPATVEMIAINAIMAGCRPNISVW